MWAVIGLAVFAIVIILGWTWFKKHNQKISGLVDKAEQKVEDTVKKAKK
jgi:phosphotransferase system  glucose/maltose/N-acetylglucosamine-specific IIC component